MYKWWPCCSSNVLSECEGGEVPACAVVATIWCGSYRESGGYNEPGGCIEEQV